MSAGLVREKPRGRRRFHHLEAAPLAKQAYHGMGEGWPLLLARLETVLTDDEG